MIADFSASVIQVSAPSAAIFCAITGSEARKRSAFNHIALAVSPALQDEIKQKLQNAGHKTIFIDHGYCQSLYVQDPDNLTLEFTSDPKNIAEIDEWQSKTAHETLSRWIGGDLKPNNNLRHR